jgi:Flp pilus assembly protein TadG
MMRLARRGRSPVGDDRGSVTVEFVTLGPVLFMMVMMIIAGSRVALAHQSVEAAAADAARSASLARTQGAAEVAGQQAGQQSVSAQGLRCVWTDVQVDTSGFAAPVGTPASVTASVSCQVDLGDMVLPGLPGSMTITETARSPLDTYRER